MNLKPREKVGFNVRKRQRIRERPRRK